MDGRLTIIFVFQHLSLFQNEKTCFNHYTNNKSKDKLAHLLSFSEGCLDGMILLVLVTETAVWYI